MSNMRAYLIKFAVAAIPGLGFFAWASGQDFSEFQKMPVEVHYSPAEDLEKIDVSLINAAKNKIDAAGRVLNDIAVIKAFNGVASRGVKIRLYRQQPERPASDSVIEALNTLLASPNVEQKLNPVGAPRMHLKSYCVDDATLRMGAANFSESGLKHEDNDLAIVHGSQACQKFEALFEEMWKR